MNAQTLELMPVEEKASTPDLAKIDLTDVALAQFGDWKGDVEAAKKKLTGLVLDLSTQTKIDEAKSLRHRTINQPIAEIRKVSKALKSKLASVSKAVGAEEETAVAAWDGVATLITPQIEAREAVLAAEKAERERIAAELKAHHQAEADKIRAYVTQAQGLPSERIAKGLEVVNGLVFGEVHTDLYEAAKAFAIDGLTRLHTEALAREEAEAQRIENERIAADLERQRRELAEQASELAKQQAEALVARIAITHASVFTFPEPEPVADVASVFVTPAEELAAAQSSPEGAELSPAAQALNEAQGAQRFARAHPVVARSLSAPKPASRITLGEINARLAPIALTAAGLSELGFDFMQDKASKLYFESDIPAICEALINRLQAVKTTAAKAA